jgi:superfamily II DNA/RNA helicase
MEKRERFSADELTSRVTTSRLNKTLDSLEKRTYSSKEMEGYQRPSNAVLATNMISVGIDIPRLNVMAVVGQPKLTSEYIQATSRVGRNYPGAVFVLYDSFRSRDRSHFELFSSYHESFYKYVEPTAVTPFSAPARDKALPAVVIALLRLLNPDLTAEDNAVKFSRERYEDSITAVKKFLLGRYESVRENTSSLLASEKDAMEKEIDEIVRHWENFATSNPDSLDYGTFSEKPDKKHLLKNLDSPREGIEVPTSMRSVSPAIGCKVRPVKKEESES